MASGTETRGVTGQRKKGRPARRYRDCSRKDVEAVGASEGGSTGQTKVEGTDPHREPSHRNE